LDDKWLITHAGLHKFNLPQTIAKLHKDRTAFLKEISIYLDSEIISGYRNKSWIFHAGASRGGLQRVGGIDWCDHNAEMYPIIGLNQIYGHSPQQYSAASWLLLDTENSQPYFKLSHNWSPSRKQLENTNAAYNLCLDVWQNTHYAIWNGSTLSIHSINDI
jgi:hypothetical protein